MKTATTPTVRDEIRTLAYRQLTFPNMSVSDDLAALSSIADRDERERQFSALCDALAAGRHHHAGRILTTLTGGERRG